MKMQSRMNPNDADEGTPVSVKIRERIAAARKRFNANDNIAPFIEPGELELLLDEVEEKMKGVLSSLVIDTERDHNTDNTARRVARDVFCKNKELSRQKYGFGRGAVLDTVV